MAVARRRPGEPDDGRGAQPDKGEGPHDHHPPSQLVEQLARVERDQGYGAED